RALAAPRRSIRTSSCVQVDAYTSSTRGASVAHAIASPIDWVAWRGDVARFAPSMTQNRAVPPARLQLPHHYRSLDPAIRRELVDHAGADGFPLSGLLYLPPRGET